MSTTRHYTLSQLSAMGVAELTLTYRSLDADTAQLRIPARRATADELGWQEGDRITLADDREPGSPRLFNGRITGITHSWAAARYMVTVTLGNAVETLKRTVYAQQNSTSGDISFAQNFYEELAENADPASERITRCRRVIEACFNWSGKGRLDCTCDIKVDGAAMGVAGSGSQSCWSLIAAAMRWVPDACTALRYAAGGDVLHFTTARRLEATTLEVGTGRIRTAAGTELGRFEGMTECNLRPRHDLVPPVCALTGRARYRLPAGGSIREPGTFLYNVRPAGLGLSREEVQAEATTAAREHMPWSYVLGRKCPINHKTAMGEVSMKSEYTGATAGLLAWWQGFGAFSILKKLGVGSLHFGQPQFEPVDVADAYPDAGEESEGAPKNYKSPSSWGTLYLHSSGRFPASAERRNNISGLQWCRGRLSQAVWVDGLPSGVSAEKLLEFFEGAAPFKLGDGSTTTCRYTVLSVEGVWLNVRRKKFREGTLEDGDEAAAAAVATAAATPATAALEGEAATPLALSAGEEAAAAALALASEEGRAPQTPHEEALRDYYRATRKLFYDGSITLTGVHGNPGAILATGINIAGLLPAWEGMETPCNEIDYDPIARRAVLTVGSRETLSMDELVARQNIGRIQAFNRLYSDGGSGSSAATIATVAASGDDEVTEFISPNISASHSATMRGKVVAPFAVYAEGSRWMLNGGSIPTPDGAIEVPPKDITEHYRPARKFAAIPIYQNGNWTVKFRYFD